MPLHTGFHPTCAVAFFPSMIQQGKTLPVKVLAVVVGKSSLLDFTYCAMESRRLKNCGSHC